MVSTVIQYCGTIFLGFILLTAVTGTLSTVVEERDNRVTEEHLTHVGQEVATLMTQQQQMAEKHASQKATADSFGITTQQFESSTVVNEPPRINGQQYTVQVGPDGEQLIVQSGDVGARATVPIHDSVDAKELSGGIGGRLLIVYEQSTGKIKIESESQQV
jgi:hypothetical protein